MQAIVVLIIIMMTPSTNQLWLTYYQWQAAHYVKSFIAKQFQLLELFST